VEWTLDHASEKLALLLLVTNAHVDVAPKVAASLLGDHCPRRCIRSAGAVERHKAKFNKVALNHRCRFA
jgi:hypothetical protein